MKKQKTLTMAVLSGMLLAQTALPLAQTFAQEDTSQETSQAAESKSDAQSMTEMESSQESATGAEDASQGESSEEKSKKDEIPTDPEELKALIKEYGHKITVNGHQMNIYEMGEEHKGQSKTLVFMPGLGEASQPLTHKNLLDLLAKKYHILVVEPFGYGLSDVSHEERTVDTIIDELHQALQQEKVDKYLLVAHSLSGIYAMKYAQKYPEEVQGVVGMDTSTPMMNGFMDMQHEEAPVDDSGAATDLPEIPDVDDEVNEQYKLIAQLNLNNEDVADESERSNQVLLDNKDEKIPAGIPALYLLAQDSYEDIEMRREFMDKITEDWEEQHISMSENPDEVETHVLEGDHLIYMTQYEEMARLIDEFAQKIK